MNNNNNINNKINVTINEQVLCGTFGIIYDWKLFQFYNIFQALIFTDKSSRIRRKYK